MGRINVVKKEKVCPRFRTLRRSRSKSMEMPDEFCIF